MTVCRLPVEGDMGKFLLKRTLMENYYTNYLHFSLYYCTNTYKYSSCRKIRL